MRRDSDNSHLVSGNLPKYSMSLSTTWKQKTGINERRNLLTVILTNSTDPDEIIHSGPTLFLSIPHINRLHINIVLTSKKAKIFCDIQLYFPGQLDLILPLNSLLDNSRGKSKSQNVCKMATQK